MKIAINLFLLLFSFTCSFYLKAEAITAGIVAGGKITATVLAEQTVGKIIQDARDEAQTLIAEAERSGNVLLIRAADQLNLSADNIMRQLDGQLSKTFKQVNQTTKSMLLGLANATSTATSLMNQAYTFKDTLTLDTRAILGNIPFVKEKLVLQRVAGLSAIVGRPEYEITLIGSYVGLPGSDHSTEISIQIDGRKVDNFRTEPSEIHVTKIIIPETVLMDSEPQKGALRIPVTFDIKQTFDERVLGFLWKTKTTKSYSSTVTLTVYPRYAGELEVIARHLEYGWVQDEPMQRSMTHEAHCSRKCGDWYGKVYSVSIDTNGNRSDQVVGDRRITSADCSKTAGTNGHSVSHGVTISEDKSKATCTIRFRTRTQTYTLTTQMERYQEVNEVDSSITSPVFFGKSVEVRIPKSTQLVLLKSKLITGEEVDLIDTEIDARSPIQIVKTIDNLADKSVFINIKDPTQ
ncbi:DivIVA domain-containing protein [Photobacterium ganghwense]|uniref:DivIVA domain-containing protein n=1 Tax=Photobacterium ganghwense TaxID=320778 RepID=UPI001C2DC844|nr:DivIVA domain-containing protein [Photobacterium ganghwense]MBV1842723.1 DivIVA domain-containing protein [Photobacterium ganghwense]